MDRVEAQELAQVPGPALDSAWEQAVLDQSSWSWLRFDDCKPCLRSTLFFFRARLRSIRWRWRWSGYRGMK